MTDTPMTVAQDIALPPLELSRPRPCVRFLAAFMISLVAALGLGASGLYAFDRQYADRILPGVTIGGIDVGGMTPQEASSRLNQAFASFAQGKAVLTSGPLEMPIDYADINRRPDLEGMVAEAMAVGRSDKTVERIILDARTALRGVDLQPKVLFDAAKLARYVDASAARLTVIARDASVTATKTGYAVVDGVPGRKADRVGPTDLLAAVLARADAPGEIKVELRVGPSQPDVTTAEATAARAAAERMTADVAIVEGKEKWTIPAATVRSWLSFSASDGVYKPVVKPDGPAKALATVAKKIGQSPLNASFTIAGGRITGVTAARNGRALNLALTSTRIHALLAARAEAATSAPVTPVTTITAPALSTADATAVIGKMTKISTWTTWFPISERNHFGANIWIPAMDIDGTVVGPGETFDFWNAVGPISRAHGYGDGGAIINGKTEPQGALAGGIFARATRWAPERITSTSSIATRRALMPRSSRATRGPRRQCRGRTIRRTRCSSGATRSGAAPRVSFGTTSTASRPAARSSSATRRSRTSGPAGTACSTPRRCLPAAASGSSSRWTARMSGEQ
jgi:vancomycin resistance protein YoaR